MSTYWALVDLYKFLNALPSHRTKRLAAVLIESAFWKEKTMLFIMSCGWVSMQGSRHSAGFIALPAPMEVSSQQQQIESADTERVLQGKKQKQLNLDSSVCLETRGSSSQCDSRMVRGESEPAVNAS